MARRKGQSIPALYFHNHTRYWCVTIDGRRHYLSRDRDEANRLYREKVAEALHGQPPPELPAGAPVTVGRALVQYLQFAENYYDCRAHFFRARYAVEAVLELYPELPVDQFTPPLLKRVRESLLARKSRRVRWRQSRCQRRPKQLPAGKPLSRSYINSLIGTVQTAWTWLVSEGLAPGGSDVALRSVRAIRAGKGGRETEDVLAVDPAVVEATIPHCGPVVRDMVRVQRLTGMRPGELVCMRRCDLSLSPDEKIAPLNSKPVSAVAVGDVVVWVYAPAAHKTSYRGKHRVVPIGPAAQRVLTPYLDRGPEAYLFSPREAATAWLREAERHVAFGADRKPAQHYTRQSYARAVHRACQRAGVPSWAPNQLRHLVAEEAREAADLDTAAAILGHARPDMTAHYAKGALLKAARLSAEIG